MFTDTEKYKALLTAIETGSFTSAAAKLGCTQSGLTHMMNALEKEIGFRVIDRGSHGVRPTEQGEAIIPKVRELVRCDFELSHEIEQIKNIGSKVLRIGCYSSMNSHWLPQIMSDFCAAFPDVFLTIRSGSVTELYNGLYDNRFDLIFTSKNTRYKCNWIPLWEDRFLAILPPDYPVDTGKSFPLTSFNEANFLMPGLGFDIDILDTFEKNHITPNIRSTFVDDPAIISMVEHGLGVSMLSDLILRGRNDNVICLPVEPAASRKLGIATDKSKTLTGPMKDFIEVAKKFAEDFSKSDPHT